MKTITWDGQGLSLAEISARPLEAGEARIRPLLMGICNTDLELMHGYKDFVGRLGHEFVGEVVEGDWLGKRVVGEINIVCGRCDMCQRGIRSQCRDRQALGITGGESEGAFGETFILPTENLFEVPENVPDEVAVFTEPLAAACRIPELHPIGVGDRVVLIGAGKLGMLCAQVIAGTGADLTVLVRREAQAEKLAQWGIKAARREEIPDAQADYVVDCTGEAEGFNAALQMTRPRGTLILKSTFAGLTPANLTDVAVREIRVEGSRCGPFDRALALMEAGQVEVQSMIEGIYPLGDYQTAFDAAFRPGALKILLQNS